MRILYFAWVREKTGLGEEVAELPAAVKTVADLVRWQQGRGGGFEAAFAEPGALRAAVDQQQAAPEHLIEGAKEIAFFPPVTGG